MACVSVSTLAIELWERPNRVVSRLWNYARIGRKRTTKKTPGYLVNSRCHRRRVSFSTSNVGGGERDPASSWRFTMLPLAIEYSVDTGFPLAGTRGQR